MCIEVLVHPLLEVSVQRARGENRDLPITKSQRHGAQEPPICSMPYASALAKQAARGAVPRSKAIRIPSSFLW